MRREVLGCRRALPRAELQDQLSPHNQHNPKTPQPAGPHRLKPSSVTFSPALWGKADPELIREGQWGSWQPRLTLNCCLLPK